MYYTVSLRLFIYKILKGELKNLIMAGNNALQFLRGSATTISSSSDVANAGQPVLI